ncbi:glutaminase family protein [Hymenobacter jejuensis]|uniref:DUF4965 domain-containing protein n=1 Tax=Hymenobacter jejuensis TaxID=2502781 RepID=A0A5B7ZX36_9BACT|nr:glutaminase family protein [Hymenobacter jejuensis]QDA59674.1 DUF4965 domain-containing protein [Hymenobacter jejuensis]
MLLKRISTQLWLAATLLAGTAQAQQLRAPAYPLVTIDPYTSVWSFGDQLYGQPTKHWTGRTQGLLGYLRVDGKTYNFLGKPDTPPTMLAASSEIQPATYRYTNTAPPSDWQKPAFNATTWTTGKGLLTTEDNAPGVHSKWKGDDVWVRRTIELKEAPKGSLSLYMLHDDDVDVYLNGEPAFACAPCFSAEYQEFPIAAKAAATLHKGQNIIALHCKNTGGPGLLDVGLVGPKPTDTRLTATQKAVRLTATQTSYQFACGPVQLDVTFTSPLLLDDLAVLSRPASYITFRAQATDGKTHDVQLYMGASPQLAINTPGQVVEWQRSTAGPLTLLRTGTKDQNVLGTKGDNVRIDWGYAYVGVDSKAATTRISEAKVSRAAFQQTGALPKNDDAQASRAANDRPVELAAVFNLGKIGQSSVNQHIILGYDDVYSVEYFGQKLRAWWRKDGTTTEQMLQAAERDYDRVVAACTKFDSDMAQEAQVAGGSQYAQLCALAYRQSIAAHKLVAGPDGKPLFFSKENFSNGSIGTVDITYPSAPLFLRYNPTLLKGMMDPIFYYTESGKWTKPFAAHDVGTYPLATGQTYGEDMPVEESGNMLILAAAIAAAEGNANYAKQHWPALTTWAQYLQKAGLDPENQLCTDDFAGHLAHNANLSVKAILGLASYGRLAGMQGDNATAATYQKLAKDMAQQWVQMAKDGDHYSLTFDQKGTWSQKYNLVWDKLLRLDVFPADIAATEINYYLTKQQPYGLPLDSRKTYSKSDWILWTATLADSPADFQKIIQPVYRYANETSDRIPLSDWHETTDGKSVGFRARSVVGGYFIKMLEKDLARKPLK